MPDIELITAPIVTSLEDTDLHWMERNGIVSRTSTATKATAFSLGWVDASRYGMRSSATAGQNTLAFANALAVALADRKGLYIPSGEIVCNNLPILTTNYTGSNGVMPDIRGAGRWNTKLITAGATSLFSNLSTSFSNGGSISDMWLFGNGVGLNGIEMSKTLQFRLSDLVIEGFVTNGLKLLGSLIGVVEHTMIILCATGVTGEPTVALDVNANLVLFNDVQFQSNNRNAVVWETAAGVHFIGCNFETNGTTGDANTGVIITNTMSPLGEGVDVTLDKCWFERNRGRAEFEFFGSGANSIRDTIMLKTTTGTTTHGVVNNGGRLYLSNVTIAEHSTTDLLTAAAGISRWDGVGSIPARQQSGGGSFLTATYS